MGLLAGGYQDQGTNFYGAADALGGCAAPVVAMVKNGHRRYTMTSGQTALAAAGWASEGPAFYAVSSQPTPTPTPPPGANAGSAPVGSTTYPAPADGVYVAPNGNDAAAGAVGTPVRTIGRALALAPSGGTVVLRGGTYHENVSLYKPVTLQGYPNEAVWLDGSEPVSGWVRDGARWRRDGWTTRFDHSPTYTQGAPDLTIPDWQFVNPATSPMAAHPDQVFLDGAPQRQVQSLGQVTPGTFFLDEATSRLYLGSDPASRASASTLFKALSIRAEGVTVKGLGFRRFSPSVFHMGAITVEAPRARIENVVMTDSATTGLSVLREDSVLDRVTVKGSGMLGIHARFADRIALTKVLATENNDEHFNHAPVSGGAKLGQTRGVSVTDSSFSGNFGFGFWEDMSCFDTVVRGSSFSDNDSSGLFLEISAKAVVGNNLLARNKDAGAKINNTSDVKMWNNTFVGNVKPLWLAQDWRRNTNREDPAVDPRVSWPDPAMPWTLGPVTVRNNVVAGVPSTARCLLCVEDYSERATAEAMGISANGNVYHRSSSTAPSWFALWSKGAGAPSIFTTLAQFRGATGQESRGREYVGTPIVDANGTLSAPVASVEASVAEPLPADVATILGRPAGTRHLGKW